MAPIDLINEPRRAAAFALIRTTDKSSPIGSGEQAELAAELARLSPIRQAPEKKNRKLPATTAVTREGKAERDKRASVSAAGQGENGAQVQEA